MQDEHVCGWQERDGLLLMLRWLMADPGLVLVTGAEWTAAPSTEDTKGDDQ